MGPRAFVLGRRIDNFTPPELRPQLDQMWDSFIAAGTQAGDFELVLPDGRRRVVDYSATANILPGMHLSILLPPVGGTGGGAQQRAEPVSPRAVKRK